MNGKKETLLHNHARLYLFTQLLFILTEISNPQVESSKLLIKCLSVYIAVLEKRLQINYQKFQYAVEVMFKIFMG